MIQELLNSIDNVNDKTEINERIKNMASFLEYVVKEDVAEITRLCHYLVESETSPSAIVEAYAIVISDIARNLKKKIGIEPEKLTTLQTPQDAKKD